MSWRRPPRRADVVIDAVLGTGAQGGLRGAAAALVEALVARGNRPLVVACDVPSGVDADTGEAHGPVLPRGPDRDLRGGQGRAAGRSRAPTSPAASQVVPIGIEEHLPGRPCGGLKPRTSPRSSRSPERRSHKYSRGVLGVVAGSASRIPAPPCWPAAARWPPAWAWCATWARRTWPTWSGSPVPKWCAAPAAVAETHVQAWLVGPGMDEDDHEQLQRVRDAAATRGCPLWPTPGRFPALPADPGPAGRADAARRRAGVPAGSGSAPAPRTAPRVEAPPSRPPGRPRG